MSENDFEFQKSFIVESSWRLMSMQDSHPLSPSRGCFHYAYWRDKTSEFPDARYQEAGAALGLLSLSAFDQDRKTSGLQSSAVLYERFSDALAAWSNQQYPDGSFDEWYKGERGFAATEFTMIAYGLAAYHLKDRLLPADRERLVSTMSKAGQWLSKRHDRIKANHEAAAAAALALAWNVTGNDAFLTAAKEKAADTLERQKPEGWFPEVGGMDLGYCSVLLDYIMLYVHVSGDESPIPAMRNLAKFMHPLVHPDGTILPEMGLCLNPYVSRLGICLLAKYDERANQIKSIFTTSTPERSGLEPYLADDLRLARWSYLPLVTWLLVNEEGGEAAAPEATPMPEGWSYFPEAQVAAYHSGDLHLYFAAAGGGAIELYKGDKRLLIDRGYGLTKGGESWSCSGYDPTRPLIRNDDGFSLTCVMGKATFFFPSFLSRLVLRIGCSSALFSRLLRAAIDAYRVRNRTAVNQSSAPVARSDQGYSIERRIAIREQDQAIVILDEIVTKENDLDALEILPSLHWQGVRQGLFTEALKGSRVEVEKIISTNTPDGTISVRISNE